MRRYGCPVNSIDTLSKFNLGATITRIEFYVGPEYNNSHSERVRYMNDEKLY